MENVSSKAGRKRASKKAAAQHGAGLQTAFQQVRELIVHGRLSPGTWIVEADLAQRLGMSRTPVRGALQWLQREGYVIEQKNVSKSRMIVAPLTKEDASELYAIVGHLEGLAGRRTAQLPKDERMEIVRELRKLNAGLKSISRDQGGRAGDIFDLDMTFHSTVVKASAGPRLMSLYNAVKPQTERYWRLYASSIINDLHSSVGEHEEIIEAIQEGDADRVEAALQLNWSNGAQRLGKVIDLFGERGTW
jgi:DNA-binding GntR family transcriptional regulator